MNTIGRFPWLLRIASAILTVTIVAGTLAPGLAETASARKRGSAKLIQGFSSTASITVNDFSQSSPAQILVSGFTTELADVDVTISNYTQPRTQDIDFLLIGPGGQTALLISDVGSGANNVTMTFDDGAANQVSSSGPLKNGIFQPTNFGIFADTFGPPAPSPQGNGSELGVFNSTDPNGVWTLLIKNGQGGGPGTLSGGWSLNITSANGVPNASPDSFQAQAGKTLDESIGVLSNDLDSDFDSLTAILAGKPKKGKVDLRPDGAFTYRAGKKAKGTDSFTYLAQDPGGLSDLETVTIQVKKAKKKGKK